MRALVVYESMFGNTEQVAHAVTHGLAEHMDVECVEVSQAPHTIQQPLDLIVVGGPTHAFSMTRARTRDDAVQHGAPLERAATGLRDWLEALPPGPHSELVATFDTRVDKMRHLPGSAARSAARAVRRLGFAQAIRPVSFYVSEIDGPLLAGETARARAWGERLAEQVRARASASS
jgi:hypothetical protein